MIFYNRRTFTFIVLSILIFIISFTITANSILHPHIDKGNRKAVKSKMMNTPIIGFDIMKLSRDKVVNQPSKALIDNILLIVKNNFPGTTHIAISTPEDSTVAFVAHGKT